MMDGLAGAAFRESPASPGTAGPTLRCGYYRDSVALPPNPCPRSCPGPTDRTVRSTSSSLRADCCRAPIRLMNFAADNCRWPRPSSRRSTEKRHLIVEAGTGTGKTLAYLVPVIRSGKRVIISTGTKNLQEQLFYKDIPFLEAALSGEGSWRLLHEGPRQLSVPQEALRPDRSPC